MLLSNIRLLSILFLINALLGSVAQVEVVGSLSQFYTVSSAESQLGTINLRNTSDEPATVQLYLVDYRFDAEGRVFYEEAGSNPRSNASWITLTQPEATLPAKSNLTTFYTVNVPDDAQLVGSYWSMLMVESAASPETRPVQEQTLAIRQMVRYAIQVVTDIGESGQATLAFVNPNLQTNELASVFAVDIENAGERHIRPEFQLELFDAVGTSLGRIDGRAKRLYPGTSVRQVFELPSVPAGTYTAIIVADAGADAIFGARYTLNITAP